MRDSVDSFASSFSTLCADPDGAPLTPFPWQRRLFDLFRSGHIPDALDLPTGLGKTSVMACWLLAHAASGGTATPLPRRLAYVVDRRAVVDQASTEAERLFGRWKAVAGAEAPDLWLATLRGQHFDSGEWTRHPADLAIVIGTVDMIGSRLLLSGYGVSPRMRPIHAGLLGLDTLLVLDEAHLSPAFAALGREISANPTLAGSGTHPVASFHFMALSATQSNPDGRRLVLGLDDSDRAHRTVSQRLSARKMLEIRQGASSEDVLSAVREVATPSARVIVFLDSRSMAEKVASALKKLFEENSVLLFTGGRRGWERKRAEADLVKFGFLPGSSPDGPVRILVATAAAEVGVDLDADHAVMDLVAWERMVQRLGRVNRRGRGAARVLICDGGQSEARGADLSACRTLFERLTSGSPAALIEAAAAAPDLCAAATTPEPLRPPLSRAEIDAWSLTTLRDHPGRAEVAPFLRGWVDDDPQVRLVWRRHLPVREQGAAEPEAERTAFFEAAPLHLSEVLEIEIGPFREWLKKRLKTKFETRRQENGDPPAIGGTEAVALFVGADGRVSDRWSLDALRERLGGARADRFLANLTSGTLVLDARIGGLSEAGMLDAARDEPPPTADGQDDWSELAGFFVDRVHDVPAALAARPEPPPRLVLPLTVEEDGDALLVRGSASSAEDGRSDHRSRGPAVRLDDHTEHVRQEVARIAAGLGLSPGLCDLLDHAARLHDLGKASRHWQTAMMAPEGGPWAKTRRGNGKALGGYRHEFGSLLAALEDPALRDLPPDDRELVLHLIASHHGNARPFIAAHGGDQGPPSTNELHAQEVAQRFAALHRRWGPWGLAWWEAVFRAADRAASAREERAPASAGGRNG